MKDFLMGLGIFVMVTAFAGVHEAPALPAPLAKTEAMIAVTNNAQPTSVSFANISVTQPVAQSSSNPTVYKGGNTKTMLIVMALLFSSLSTITFQFWRNLRREYASPRRKRGRG